MAPPPSSNSTLLNTIISFQSFSGSLPSLAPYSDCELDVIMDDEASSFDELVTDQRSVNAPADHAHCCRIRPGHNGSAKSVSSCSSSSTASNHQLLLAGQSLLMSKLDAADNHLRDDQVCAGAHSSRKRSHRRALSTTDISQSCFNAPLQHTCIGNNIAAGSFKHVHKPGSPKPDQSLFSSLYAELERIDQTFGSSCSSTHRRSKREITPADDYNSSSVVQDRADSGRQIIDAHLEHRNGSVSTAGLASNGQIITFEDEESAHITIEDSHEFIKTRRGGSSRGILGLERNNRSNNAQSAMNPMQKRRSAEGSGDEYVIGTINPTSKKCNYSNHVRNVSMDRGILESSLDHTDGDDTDRKLGIKKRTEECLRISRSIDGTLNCLHNTTSLSEDQIQDRNAGNRQLDNTTSLSEDQIQDRNAGNRQLELGDKFDDADMKKIHANEKLMEIALVDPKRVKRILANRQSAARSKERKTRYITELEHKVQDLQSQTSCLLAQLHALRSGSSRLSTENKTLKLRLQAMEKQSQLREALNEALREEVQRLKLATIHM